MNANGYVRSRAPSAGRSRSLRALAAGRVGTTEAVFPQLCIALKGDAGRQSVAADGTSSSALMGFPPTTSMPCRTYKYHHHTVEQSMPRAHRGADNGKVNANARMGGQTITSPVPVASDVVNAIVGRHPSGKRTLNTTTTTLTVTTTTITTTTITKRYHLMLSCNHMQTYNRKTHITKRWQGSQHTVNATKADVSGQCSCLVGTQVRADTTKTMGHDDPLVVDGTHIHDGYHYRQAWYYNRIFWAEQVWAKGIKI